MPRPFTFPWMLASLAPLLLLAAGCPEDGPSRAELDSSHTLFEDFGSQNQDLTVDILPGEPFEEGDQGAPGFNDYCTSPEVLSWTGAPITKSGDTSNASNQIDLAQSGCVSSLVEGGDLFYRLTLNPGHYTLVLTPGPGLDQALYVLTSCDPLVCTAGSDAMGMDIPETVELHPTTITTYIIVVDAVGPAEDGPFTLIISGSATNLDGGVWPDFSSDSALPADAASLPDTWQPEDSGGTGPISATCLDCDLSVEDCTGYHGTFSCIPKSGSCTYTDGTLFRQCNCTGWQFCLNDGSWSLDCEEQPSVFSCL